MEERIMDDEESRKIRIKRTKDGETDAVEGESEEEEVAEEIVLELPEEEYDEDLVGLTPSQLKAELERRKRAEEEARLECAKMLAEAKKLVGGENYKSAEAYYAQALVYDPENEEARKGIWYVRTGRLTNAQALLTRQNAEQFSEENKKVRAYVLNALGQQLKETREAAAKEEAELAPVVEAAREERRKAFRDNRNYYGLRFCIVLAVAVLLAIGCIVSASFIYRVNTPEPVILTAVFGGATLVVLIVLIFFCRKLFVAQRLCRQNENPRSTADGAKLADLRTQLYHLSLVLDGEKEEE